MGEFFAKQRPGASLTQFLEEVFDPSIEFAGIENGTTLDLNEKFNREDIPFERIALLTCSGYTAQALRALELKDIELAALLTIDAFFWLGMLGGVRRTQEVEKEAIAKFCAVGPTSQNKEKYGKLKKVVESIALLQPEGPWKSLAQAARYITPIMLGYQEALGQYLDTDDPLLRVKIWLGKMENKSTLFGIEARRSRVGKDRQA